MLETGDQSIRVVGGAGAARSSSRFVIDESRAAGEYRFSPQSDWGFLAGDRALTAGLVISGAAYLFVRPDAAATASLVASREPESSARIIDA